MWKRLPSLDELHAISPWLQVHDFGTVQTPVAHGSEQSSDFFRERADLLKRVLSELSGLCETKTLVELGCASGLHCFTAAEEGWLTTGFDPREVHIRQAEFLRSLLVDTIASPNFFIGSDKDLRQSNSIWDVGICYGVLEVLAEPIEMIASASKLVKTALVIETGIYVPNYELEGFFRKGDNWTYSAPCMLSNMGSLRHNKKGIDKFTLLFSLPALVFVLFSSGFSQIAYVNPPNYWESSESRGLRNFFTGDRCLLIAFKETSGCSIRSQDWVWFSRPPELLNYDYYGPLSVFRSSRRASPATNVLPERPSFIDKLRLALGRKIVVLGQLLQR